MVVVTKGFNLYVSLLLKVLTVQNIYMWNNTVHKLRLNSFQNGTESLPFRIMDSRITAWSLVFWESQSGWANNARTNVSILEWRTGPGFSSSIIFPLDVRRCMIPIAARPHCTYGNASSSALLPTVVLSICGWKLLNIWWKNFWTLKN